MSHLNEPMSLKQWLDRRTSTDGKANGRHSKDYESWDVKRPSEEARKLIRAVLVKLRKLHASGESHGALFDPENYLIRRWNRWPREWEYEIQFLDPKEGNLGGSLEEMQARDTSAVMKIIFGTILPDEVSTYSLDIQHLHNALANDCLNKEVLANHPSVWGWRERIFFFLKLTTWSKFHCEEDLTKLFRFVNGNYSSWGDQLQSGTPLHKVSRDRRFPYGNKLEDLVRFIRNVFEHITEENLSGGNNKYKYIHDPRWLQEKFVENEITKLFPLLLVELYEGLFEAGLKCLSPVFDWAFYKNAI